MPFFGADSDSALASVGCFSQLQQKWKKPGATHEVLPSLERRLCWRHLVLMVWMMFWLVLTGTWLDYDFPIILWISSSQLTNSIIFQRGRAQPPTSVDFASFWIIHQLFTKVPGCFNHEPHQPLSQLVVRTLLWHSAAFPGLSSVHETAHREADCGWAESWISSLLKDLDLMGIMKSYKPCESGRRTGVNRKQYFFGGNFDWSISASLISGYFQRACVDFSPRFS